MPTALVTGGNRGIGLEVCRQLASRGYRVLLGARDAEKGRAAAREITGTRGEVTFMRLDVADPSSIRALETALAREKIVVDVLVNNAALYLDEGRSVLDVDPKVVRTMMDTNLHGPLALSQALMPGMIDRGFGRVVNVSSNMGQLSTMIDDAPGYSLSKAALNALTRMLADAARTKDARDVLVNAVHPGWVKTTMGGPSATRSVEEGADGIVWLATMPAGGPNGGLFHDREPMAW